MNFFNDKIILLCNSSYVRTLLIVLERTMFNPLKLKMLLCKIFTSWIIPAGKRKLIREFLFWFSYEDYCRFKNAGYKIVSLGNSCLTRALLVAAGLKPRRFYGEKSCPFDLCRSNDIKRITELIDNDFSDFFERINLNAFPHDDKLTVRDFKKRYKSRISNFLDIQNSEKTVYYIYSNYDKVPETEEIIQLYKVIKSKRGVKPFKLIVLTTVQLDVVEIIQIPYDIQINDSRAIEFIINRYGEYNNKFTEFRNRMEKELKRIING